VAHALARYCEFYRAAVPDSVTDEVWHRIVSPSLPDSCALACLDETFVAPAARGRGIGHVLIDHVLEQARARGCARLYWMTEADNVPARALYDSFTRADGFVRYAIPLRSD
jgi:GNAT superfamily N-acetyltransferase